MKVKIEIEQFDNGITLKWEDGRNSVDNEHLVALEGDKYRTLGKMLLEDVKAIMDSKLCNIVVLNIEYEPIKEE